MTDEDLIQQLRDMHYPGRVDAVDAVMAQVANRPLLAPAPPRPRRWIRYTSAAAACALLAVGVNMALLLGRQYDSQSIGSCMAEVYDYHTDYGYAAENGAVSEHDFGTAEEFSKGYDIGVEELFY